MESLNKSVPVQVGAMEDNVVLVCTADEVAIVLTPEQAELLSMTLLAKASELKPRENRHDA